MGRPVTTPPPDLARRFEQFARIECHGSSPLYERLSLEIAKDPELLALAARSQPGQPVPNMLFGAVQYLLLRDPATPLAAFYPTVSGRATSVDGNPFPLFRAYCLEHKFEIATILETRLVQTNEVRRSAALLPVFETVRQRSGGRGLSLVEIGASAGLNLLVDRYFYDYGQHLRCGPPGAPVRITCALEGDLRPPVPPTAPPIASRTGIDLNPVDVRDPEQGLWLRALIWPEHTARARLLQEAMAVAEQAPPALLQGDALDLLPDVLNGLPSDTALCLFHTFTLNQFTLDDRRRFEFLLRQEATRRPVYRVSVEYPAGERVPRVDLTTLEEDQRSDELLGLCHPHGEWLHWLAKGTKPPRGFGTGA